MRPFQSACWCLIILLSTEIQPRPLTLTAMAHKHRLSSPRVPESSPPIVPGSFDRPVALDNAGGQRGRDAATPRSPAPADASPRPSGAPPDRNHRTPEGGSAPRLRPRARRHANNNMVGRSHVQLMRVGCVLGTCQVQNLSHRLYQLIGQRGREDSSPINPRSPHSYG